MCPKEVQVAVAPMIEVEALSKRFGETQALEQINSVGRGGPGGCAAGTERSGQNHAGASPHHPSHP